jgi:hypothetical protein
MAIARRRATMCLFGFALLLVPIHAEAQPRGSGSGVPAQARDHVRAGMAYAERGKWEDALREFEEAYALEPQPLRLFDVAQARFKTNRFRAAADAYAKLIDAPSLSPEQHERVRAGLASSREKIAHVRVTVANARAGDVVTIDGVVAARDALVDLDPGHHVARLVRDGETTENAIDLEPGATMTVTLTAKAPPSPPPPPPAPVEAKKPGVPTLSWILAGTSLVSLSFGTYFGLVGLHKYNRLMDDPCAARKTCGRAESNSMKTHLVIGDALLGLGVATAGAALVLWLVARTTPAGTRETPNALRIIPGLGSGTLAITF